MQVAAAAGKAGSVKPVVLVVMSGGVVDLAAAKANPAVQSIIWCV